MKTVSKLAAMLVLASAAAPVAAEGVSREKVEAIVEAAFADAPADVKGRIYQDETQATCSQYRDQPPDDVAATILAREQANIRYPESGVLMGDWKTAIKESNNGYGWRMGDKPDRVVGGNCYACHQLAPDEVAYGNLGPSLTGYGAGRDVDEAVIKATYDKVYNAQSVLACSQMPRFGANGFLTPEQVADYVAMLLDPESPVNK